VPAQVGAMMGTQSANLAVHGFGHRPGVICGSRWSWPVFARPVAVVSLFMTALFGRNSIAFASRKHPKMCLLYEQDCNVLLVLIRAAISCNGSLDSLRHGLITILSFCDCLSVFRRRKNNLDEYGETLHAAIESTEVESSLLSSWWNWEVRARKCAEGINCNVHAGEKPSRLRDRLGLTTREVALG